MQYNRISAMAATLGTVCVLSGCGTMNRSTTVESAGDVATGSVITPTNNRTIPAGVRLTATLDQTLGTKASKAGDFFSATVTSALYASDGSVVVPAGA